MQTYIGDDAYLAICELKSLAIVVMIIEQQSKLAAPPQILLFSENVLDDPLHAPVLFHLDSFIRPYPELCNHSPWRLGAR